MTPAGRSQLSPRAALIVTPARRIGGLRCFRLQRRLGRALADTATVVIRGPDLFTASLELQAGGSQTNARPDPPIQSVSGTELNWSGTFGS